MAKEIFLQAPGNDELVVILHGLFTSPAGIQPLIDAARCARPNADILAPPLPIGGWLGAFCRIPSERIAATLVDRIQQAVDARGPAGYTHIVLTGHSFGAVFARKVAIIAHGEQADAPFESRIAVPEYQKPRNWAGAIERLVLLASMSRGWLPESTRTWLEQVKWSLGSWIAELLALVRYNLTIMDIRRGMPFIVQTRLQWLALAANNGAVTETRKRWLESQRAIRGGKLRREMQPQMPVLQLLGAVDELVSPNDSVDLSVDTADNAPFKLIELPLTDHVQATEMKEPTRAQRQILVAAMKDASLPDVCKANKLAAEARWLLFERAMSEHLDQLDDIAIEPEFFADVPTITHARVRTIESDGEVKNGELKDKDVKDFVFVIHGIRDHGFWTQKIARVIKRKGARANPPRNFLSFTGSYGYFAMVPFLFRWVRKWKAAWLMDQYVEVRARFAKAEFSFVGHSNGTYLLASILQDYPAARFGRVVFAGSVVRRDFPWSTYLTASAPGRPPRVKEVLNYVATRDWVVAIFPKGFQVLKAIFDLGSAGHDGFDQYRQKAEPGWCGFVGRLFRKPVSLSGVPLCEARCVIGAHSAGIEETQWDDIARFIISGTMPTNPSVDFQDRRAWWMVGLGWISSLILLFGIWIIVGTGISLFKSITGDGTVTIAALVPHPASWIQGALDTIVWVCQGAISILTHIPDIVCAAFRWIWNAAQGTITTYAAPQQLAPGEVAKRAAVFVAYVWVVYLFVTRF